MALLRQGGHPVGAVKKAENGSAEDRGIVLFLHDACRQVALCRVVFCSHSTSARSESIRPSGFIEICPASGRTTCGSTCLRN